MTSLTENYVALPKKLVRELRDNPLAIALYFLVARLYLIHQAPIPLSRSDIRRFDPSLKVGTVKRALDRLLEAGWLIETPGYKSSYAPTWGTARSGAPYPWAIQSDLLGCPKGIWKEAIRMNRSLLDIFVGKLTPSKRLAANTSGFFADCDGRHISLLQLQEVGSYILAVAGYPIEHTDTLRYWGLLDMNLALPIPTDDIVLALASQRASLTTFQLTKAAWHVLGFGFEPPSNQGEASLRPLLFVPKERIGHQIGSLIGERIGHASPDDVSKNAPACGKQSHTTDSPNMTGNPRDSNNSKDTTTKVEGFWIDLSETETVTTLRAFGVFERTCLTDLAHMPIEPVKEAISYAQSNQLGPGWVVQALRRHQLGEPLPNLRKPGQQGFVDWKAEQQKYGDLLCSDTGTATIQQAPTDSQKLEQQTHNNLLHKRHDLNRYMASGHNIRSDDMSQQVREQLRLRHSRQHHRLINALSVVISAHTTVIQCSSLADRMVVLGTLMPAVRAIVKELGLPGTVQVMEKQVKVVDSGVVRSSVW